MNSMDITDKLNINKIFSSTPEYEFSLTLKKSYETMQKDLITENMRLKQCLSMVQEELSEFIDSTIQDIKTLSSEKNDYPIEGIDFEKIRSLEILKSEADLSNFNRDIYVDFHESLNKFKMFFRNMLMPYNIYSYIVMLNEGFNEDERIKSVFDLHKLIEKYKKMAEQLPLLQEQLICNNINVNMIEPSLLNTKSANLSVNPVAGIQILGSPKTKLTRQSSSISGLSGSPEARAKKTQWGKESVLPR